MKTFLLSLLLLTFAYSYAQTTVGGTISSNTTWYPSGNPYIVTDSVIVNENITLTIKPGVIVKFNKGGSPDKYSIVVNGTLRAIGTEDSVITFTSNEFIPSSGDWGAFIFHEPAQDYDFSNQTGCILQYCNMEYGGHYDFWIIAYALIVMKGSSVYIDHCMISKTYNCEAIHSSGSASEIRITNNKFITMGGFLPGNVLIDLAMDSSAEISCNLFYRDDGPTSSGVHLNFHHNLVVRQFDAGFSIGTQEGFHYNTIVDCRTAHDLFYVYGHGLLDHNTITRNTYAESGARNCITIGDTNAKINNNNIYGQLAEFDPFYEIGNYILRESYLTTPLDATNNWFNKNSTAEIDQVIHDNKDDTTLYLINYEPYLLSPDIDAPITPPTGVTKTDIGGNNVLVTWNPNPDADVAGYKIYWGDPSGYSFSNSIDVGNVTSYTLTNFLFNDTVAVTAYDVDASGTQDQCEGHESWFTYDYFFTGTSASPPSLNHLRCYPNPADQYTVLDVDNPGNQNGQLVIRSSIGETVKILKFDSRERQTIQLSDLPSGIYQIGLTGELREIGFLKLAIVR